ncbi:hypothetical protein RB653_000356 [Dictyostelium firmibasis]|uniref:Transmembrane protein n=1 Tax=Dictyostelium firmibasis TaxID=79012 RepID=A0AAN7Z144_9MYCE
MLFSKSLLLLISFIFAIFAISGATYTDFKVSGSNCDPNKIIKGENGTCQKVCNLYGKLFTTQKDSTFNIQLFADDSCKSQIISREVTCLPHNKPLDPINGYTITCIEPESNSSSTIIASMFLATLGVLLLLL